MLYGDFPGGKSEIVRAVALDGSVDLARRCRAALGHSRGRCAIEAAAVAYLDFGRAHPAVYEAMSQQSIDAPFASADTPPDPRAGFDALAAAIGDDGGGTTTEVFWGALHGISLPERAARMRPEHRAERVAELSARFGQ